MASTKYSSDGRYAQAEEELMAKAQAKMAEVAAKVAPKRPEANHVRLHDAVDELRVPLERLATLIAELEGSPVPLVEEGPRPPAPPFVEALTKAPNDIMTYRDALVDRIDALRDIVLYSDRVKS